MLDVVAKSILVREQVEADSIVEVQVNKFESRDVDHVHYYP